MYRLLIGMLALILMNNVYADDCTGNSDYQVCTKTEQQSNGDQTVSSYDTEGNDYSVTSGSREHADGTTEVFSNDSEGNQYSVKSWCDSAGCHSEDSEGNTCTITSDGETIGCDG